MRLPCCSNSRQVWWKPKTFWACQNRQCLRINDGQDLWSNLYYCYLVKHTNLKSAKSYDWNIELWHIKGATICSFDRILMADSISPSSIRVTSMNKFKLYRYELETKNFYYHLSLSESCMVNLFAFALLWRILHSKYAMKSEWHDYPYIVWLL